MKVHLIEVKSKSQLRKFIDFPEQLYANCPYWVPSLRGGEFDTLGKNNPALEFSELIMFLAYDKDKLVGRIAGIINHKANEKWREKTVRFGWIDFIDNYSVAKALLQEVQNWGKERGMTKMVGPVGFNNLDKSGLLIEGFEYLSPFTCIYNYPYYGEYLERFGFEKEADWTQTMMEINEVPQRLTRLSKTLEQRYGFHIYQPRNRKEMKVIGRKMFYLYNEAFTNIYGSTPLTEKQIDFSLASYMPIMNNKYISFVLDKNEEIAGFAVSVPSISKALQKVKGRLFPFGFIPILKALHKNDTLEALLIGILPKYQGMGVNALMMSHIHSNMKSIGVHKILANPRLEDNHKAQHFFGSDYTETFYARRRSYKKEI